ncbi:MAG: hypothetical protein ACRDY7_02785 [Acidimicrobiia bacterium]
MSATAWAAAALAAVAAVLAGVVLVVLASLVRTLRALAAVVEDLNRETVPLLAELRGDAAKASAELDRVEDLVGAAESVTRRVDDASRLAYLTFANPVVKVMAFGSGVGRAGRRLRGRPAKGR